MPLPRRLPRRPLLRPAALVAAALVALPAGGCLGRRAGDVTGSIGAQAGPQDEARLRAEAEALGRSFDADPGERRVSLRYARLLQGLDQRVQAAAVLERAALRQPKDTEVLAAYGKALSETGRVKEAAEVLGRAHTPERPDWRILSAQGVVSDKLGDHAGALKFYEAALRIAPDEPSLLSNQGFSLALARRLEEAEASLRRAAAHPRADMRVRQNLVLVLGLSGKFAEAEALAGQDLSPAEAAGNIAYLKRLVSQPNPWKSLREQGGARTPRG